jgi:hypothetical protein
VTTASNQAASTAAPAAEGSTMEREEGEDERKKKHVEGVRNGIFRTNMKL